MRNAFASALVRAAQADARVVLLTGDHGYALFDEFRRACPSQYVNAGVAEQNMVGVAAGLAKGGLRPVVYGLSAFIPVRVLEQIKLDVCYEELPVIFMGDGAGVVYSTLGTSHQSTEDIAALRALPHMRILSPADAAEMTACMALVLGAAGPTYVRMGKADLGPVHASPPEFGWGDLCLLKRGSGKLAWIATGSMVKTALAVSQQWDDSAVWSAPSIKPLNANHIVAIARKHEAIIVLEEHSIYAGLGSAVAEIVAEKAPAWVCRIGIEDRFSRYCGSYRYLMAEHHLNVEAVMQRVQNFIRQLPPTTATVSAPARRKPAAA